MPLVKHRLVVKKADQGQEEIMHPIGMMLVGSYVHYDQLGEENDSSALGVLLCPSSWTIPCFTGREEQQGGHKP